ncbi:growth-regulating factor 2 isoform X2 [Manihot esculenta]|uniref:growth-regulating factor 2 isoform X2 n=1 Tax=Manihot esculenta TaxID=3983 RepID=UPI000B5D2863|nr:growth-regulating factor 2 isoform X2 [Manihot esculenta]
MDFGFPSFDDFVVSGSTQAASQAIDSNDQKAQQFKLVREERPSGAWRTTSTYMPAGTVDFSVPKTMLLSQAATLWTPADSMVDGDACQPGKMLNYPSLRPEVAPFPSKNYGLAQRTPLNSTGFLHYQSLPSAYPTSYGSGSLNVTGPSIVARGPFTLSQRMELEYQALIFKYLSANVPVPPALLLPLKIKPIDTYPYGSPCGFYRPASMGWSSTLDVSCMGSPADTEPGRCRRTDGKKWRCSRDVVGDQKYCERHLNRGRHRSRKHVEGQTVPSTTQQTANSEVVPAATSISALLISHGNATDKHVNGIIKQQSKISEAVTAVNLKSDESPFTVLKPVEEESSLEFGHISSESFISYSKRRRSVKSSDCEPFLSFNEQESEDEHPLRQFIEDWPEDQCSRSTISWPQELKSDWTQLSMSTPTQEKIAFSPLSSSREFDPCTNGFNE